MLPFSGIPTSMLVFAPASAPGVLELFDPGKFAPPRHVICGFGEKILKSSSHAGLA
jgi:hypothetical protein